jgi:hypothetical protein
MGKPQRLITVDIHEGELRLTLPDGTQYTQMRSIDIIEDEDERGVRQVFAEGLLRLTGPIRKVSGMLREDGTFSLNADQLMACPVDLTRETLGDQEQSRWRQLAQKLSEYPLDSSYPVTEKGKKAWEEFLKNWDWRSELLGFLRGRIREMSGE